MIFHRILVGCLAAGTAAAFCGAAENFETDFRDAAALKGSIGAFLNPGRFTFVPAEGGKRAIVITRGGPIPTLLLKKKLSANEDCGYSFDFTRLAENSSFAAGFVDKTSKVGSAMMWVQENGRLMVRAEGIKYADTGIRLTAGVKYHVEVAYNSLTRTVTVAMPGEKSFRVKCSWSPELDRFVLSPQAPQGNRNRIENFRLYRKEGGKAPAALKDSAPRAAEKGVFATDFAGSLSLQGSEAAFTQPNKLNFVATAGGKRALVVRRGAPIPVVVWKKGALTDKEAYGYRFDVVRPEAKSTFCCGFVNAKSTLSTGMVWIHESGRLLVLDGNKKYLYSGVTMKVGQPYHVDVKVSPDTRTVTVTVDNGKPYSVKTTWAAGLDRFIFSPQQPVGNKIHVANFRMYRK